jgi:hypothetical protein
VADGVTIPSSSPGGDSDALILHAQNMAPLMESIVATGKVSAAQMAGSPVGLCTLYQAL